MGSRVTPESLVVKHDHLIIILYWRIQEMYIKNNTYISTLCLYILLYICVCICIHTHNSREFGVLHSFSLYRKRVSSLHLKVPDFAFLFFYSFSLETFLWLFQNIFYKLFFLDVRKHCLVNFFKTNFQLGKKKYRAYLYVWCLFTFSVM